VYTVLGPRCSDCDRRQTLPQPGQAFLLLQLGLRMKSQCVLALLNCRTIAIPTYVSTRADWGCCCSAVTPCRSLLQPLDAQRQSGSRAAANEPVNLLLYEPTDRMVSPQSRTHEILTANVAASTHSSRSRKLVLCTLHCYALTCALRGVGIHHATL
jgi:hypothetical protein